jgi:hypothetical protein
LLILKNFSTVEQIRPTLGLVGLLEANLVLAKYPETAYKLSCYDGGYKKAN